MRNGLDQRVLYSPSSGFSCRRGSASPSWPGSRRQTSKWMCWSGFGGRPLRTPAGGWAVGLTPHPARKKHNAPARWASLVDSPCPPGFFGPAWHGPRGGGTKMGHLTSLETFPKLFLHKLPEPIPQVQTPQTYPGSSVVKISLEHILGGGAC